MSARMGDPTAENRVHKATEVSREDTPGAGGDLEKTTSMSSGNLVYDDDDEEPVIHIRTYIALLSMFLMNFVQTFALQGPPSVVSQSSSSHRNM
jgi:hypothetical protein